MEKHSKVMDKKGSFTVGMAIFVVIILSGLFSLIGLFFFKSTRLWLIGLGLLVGSLIMAVNITKSARKPTRGIYALAFIFFFSGLLLILSSGFGLLQTFAVTSISNVDVINQGQRILIYATATGGDELDITFSPSNLNSHLQNEGYAATQSSRLRAEFIGSNKQITFGNSQTATVKLINSRPSGTYWGIVGSVQNCKNNGFSNTVAVMLDIPGRYKCFESYNNGNVNGFTGTLTGGFQVRFNLDGEQATLSEQATSISLANGDARIAWVGNLLSINEVQAPSQYQVFHVSNSWYLVDATAYTDVSNAYQNFQSYVGTGPVSQTRFNSGLQTYNQVVSTRIHPQDQTYVNANSNVGSISFTEGVMRVNLRQPSFIPTFTIELDADRVGLVHLSGEPEIIGCIDNQVFSSATSQNADVVVRNSGNQAGLFEFSVACDNSQMTGVAAPESFNAGQTRTIGMQLSGGNTGTSTNEARCTLTVRDRNSQQSDTCQFDFDVEYNSAIGQCTGTETQCSPDMHTLYTCENGRFQPSICALNELCTVTGSNAQCVQQTGPPAPSGTPTGGITLAQCEEKARNSPLLGYTFVASETQDCGFFCRFGLADPSVTVTSKCVAQNVPLFMIGAVAIIGISTVIIFLFRRPKRRRK